MSPQQIGRLTGRQDGGTSGSGRVELDQQVDRQADKQAADKVQKHAMPKQYIVKQADRVQECAMLG